MKETLDFLDLAANRYSVRKFTEETIPDNIEPVALLIMGYPAADAKPYPGHYKFKPLEEIVSYNKF